MAVLIAFYSRAGENYFGGAYRRISLGNTEKTAEMLAGLTGGELYKNVAELLMSDKGAFISGSTFLIDGGATASYFYGPLKPEA